MNILVCRPDADSIELVKILTTNQTTATSLPTIYIDYKTFTFDANKYTDVIFTSKYAVDSFVKLYDSTKISSLQIYSVGAGTAKYLAKFGLTAKYPDKHNSEELFKLISKTSLKNKKFAIISGVRGNNYLLESLIASNVCDKYEVYERKFECLQSLVDKYKKIYINNFPNVIVVTSLDVFKSLNRIFKIISPPSDAIVTITSTKMLEFVNNCGFHNTLKLDRVDNESIYKQISEILEV